MNNLFLLSIFVFGKFDFGAGCFNDTGEICNSDEQTNVSSINQIFLNRYPVELWERHGFFTKEYLEKINEHWLSFLPQSKESHYVLAGLYLVIMAVGAGGNLLVIFLFLRCKTLRTPANTLVMNLAISDLLMMSKMPIFIYNSAFLGPALGDIACKYYGFVGGLSGTCSICTLSAISLDRYYVVKFPLNRRFTSIRAKICVIISWMYGLTFSSIPLLNLGFGSYSPEGYLTSCSFDYLSKSTSAKNFILVFFVAAWVLPFLIILFAYVNILKVVRVSKNISEKNLTNRDSTRHMKVEERRRQELRLAFVVFFVILLWFVAWTPYAVVALLGIFGMGNLITPLTSMIPALFAKSASCLDPFVYALTHPRFKSELNNLIYKGRRVRRKSIRMWTTQTPDRRLTRRTYSENTDNQGNYDDDDENSSVVDLRAETRRIPSRNYKQLPSSLTLKEGSSAKANDGDLFQSSLKIRQRWWFKPSFSNRTSSIRGLTRSWTSKERDDNSSNIRDSEINITHSI